eukprot:578827-Prymnesium_polylepis.1
MESASHPRVRANPELPKAPKQFIRVTERGLGLAHHRYPAHVHERRLPHMVLVVELIDQTRQLRVVQDLLDQRLFNPRRVDVDLDDYEIIAARDGPEHTQRVVPVSRRRVHRHVEIREAIQHFQGHRLSEDLLRLPD